jgi:hypothetical protein
MASLAETRNSSPHSAEQRERRFFLNMAIAIAVTVLLGFGAYVVLGISSFGAPWWVHVHALTYMGWIALYLNQNRLVVRGDIAQHQRMGRVMAGWAVWMTLVGFAILYFNTVSHRTPPIFTASLLVTTDSLNLVLFVLLLGAGLRMRRHSDWHRRLMLCTTICLIAPALGRITVLTGGFSMTRIAAGQLGFIAVGMARDWRVQGRIHPAYFWGAAAMVAMRLLIAPLAALPAVTGFVESLAAG